MDDYEYEEDYEEEFEEEDYFEDEVEIEEEDFEEEVEEEDFEEEVEDDGNSEEEEEDDDFEEEVEEEEDSEEIDEQDGLILLEMTSLRVYDEEEEEEEEEASEFVPLGMTSHRTIHEDEDDYMDEEVHELIPARMTSRGIIYEDEEEQLDELIPPEITSPSPRIIYEDEEELLDEWVPLEITSQSPRIIYEDEEEQLDELIPLEITSPSPRVIYGEEREQVDELIPLVITPPSVLLPVIDGRDLQGSVAINDGLVHDSNECEGNLLGKHENDNVADACPICFEAWTSGGNHQVCCLPCGHVYGMSCIKKWVQSSGKCPQCKSVCTLKDIIVLYATRLCVADKELHKTSTTTFPFTLEGFSALQQYALSLQQRVEAMNLKADHLFSCLKSLEQKCKERMRSEEQSTEH